MDESYRLFRTRVKELGLMERAYGYYTLYALVVFGGIVGSLYLITLTDSLLIQIPNAVFLGLILVQTGMFGHDLSHNQVFASRRMNSLFATLVWGLFGGLSESKWYEKHNAHHESPNHIGHDPDLEIPFAFSAKQVPLRSSFFKKVILPYQHVLFFASLPFIYAAWVVYSMRHIFHNFSLRTSLELFLMTIRFTILFYVIFAYLPLASAILVLVLVFGVGGLYMSLVFAPNHKGEEVLGEHEEETWLHQIVLTRNIYPSQFVFHVFGGLNFQIEHHLFPNMARIRYFKVQPLVKQFCKENNIPYHETTFLGSMKEIYHSLKEQSKLASPIPTP